MLFHHYFAFTSMVHAFTSMVHPNIDLAKRDFKSAIIFGANEGYKAVMAIHNEEEECEYDPNEYDCDDYEESNVQTDETDGQTNSNDTKQYAVSAATVTTFHSSAILMLIVQVVV
jgi:hypothetical protein